MFDDFFSTGDSKPAHIKPLKTIPVVEVKQHARLGASSSSCWTICHAAPRLQDGLPDRNFMQADIGTICHDLSEKCLKADDDVLLSMALGKNALVEDNGLVIYRSPGEYTDGHIVTEAMITWASTYIEFVRAMVMSGAKLMVEARLSIEHITGEPGAKGTSDSVLIFPDELCIVDLKCGFMKVYASDLLEGIHFSTAPKDLQMSALFAENGPAKKPNTQLTMYAEAARNELADALQGVKRIRLIIVQPTLDHIDEFVISVEEHLEWVEWIRQQAEATRSPDAKAVPGPKQCMFCRAYPCDAAERLAIDTAFVDFDAFDREETRRPRVSELAKLKRMLPMLRKYCDYIEGRVYSELMANRPVDGFKLVNGEQGDREWINPVAAEFAMIEAGVGEDDRYKRKLISPAQLEQLSKGKRAKLDKGAWKKISADHVTRAPASGFKVVEAQDPRDAVTPAPADDFDSLQLPSPSDSSDTSWF